GLIATNTIAQGDTREGGLKWICVHEGDIFSANRRYRWPGEAAVVVSIIHIAKGSASVPCMLDGRLVPMITAFLFHAGGHDNPHRLKENIGRSRLGSKIYGQGFLFGDNDPASTPIAQMLQLIKSNPRNKDRIFYYINGEEVNDSPNLSCSRHVINFG